MSTYNQLTRLHDVLPRNQSYQHSKGRSMDLTTYIEYGPTAQNRKENQERTEDGLDDLTHSLDDDRALLNERTRLASD